jgi:hypothetical protein
MEQHPFSLWLVSFCWTSIAWVPLALAAYTLGRRRIGLRFVFVAITALSISLGWFAHQWHGAIRRQEAEVMDMPVERTPTPGVALFFMDEEHPFVFWLATLRWTSVAWVPISLAAFACLALSFGWFVYDWSWATQRRDVFATGLVRENLNGVNYGPMPKHAPTPIRLFGCSGFWSVRIAACENSAEFQRIRTLFPEASAVGDECGP